MEPIRLAAFDLDDTLLTGDKRLTQVTIDALYKAKEAGVILVPATGRFYDGVPEAIHALAFLRYFITSNGAYVYDRQEKKAIVKAAMSWQEAVEIMRFLDGYDVIYDCYVENGGLMTKSLRDKAPAYMMSDYYLERIYIWRKPVEELKAHLQQTQQEVYKIQAFTKDMELRSRLLEALPRRFPRNAVATSIVNNIEINAEKATKGQALQALCDRLDIPIKQAAAFGDDRNDLSMLRTAGIGVAMGNAKEIVKAAADLVTKDCDHDGVAQALLRLF